MGDAANASQADDAGSCEARTSAASTAIVEALDQADSSCSVDAECMTTFLGSDCWHGCGAVVSAAGKRQLDAVVAEQDQTTCAGFTERGCIALVPPCVAPGVAACIAGECVEYQGIASSVPALLSSGASSGSQVDLTAGQRLELRLQTIGGGQYLAAQVSSSVLRFAQSFDAKLKNPGGPTQIYVFQGEPGTASITIPHSVRPDPFKLTVNIR